MGSGIVDGDFYVYAPEFRAGEAFRDVRPGCSGVSCEIEPGFIVESYPIDYECISVPATYGVAPPGFFYAWVVSPAIEKDLAIAVHVAFVEDQKEAGRLHDFPGIGIFAGRAHGEAKAFEVVLAVLQVALTHQLRTGHAQQFGGESPLPNLMEVKG